MRKNLINDDKCELVNAICNEYGFPFDSDDLYYDENENVCFTPFDGDAGIVCYNGEWEMIGFNSGNIRLIDASRDYDMFNEIAVALA